jgi:Leucine-rich repeat (LRR) protein
VINIAPRAFLPKQFEQHSRVDDHAPIHCMETLSAFRARVHGRACWMLLCALFLAAPASANLDGGAVCGQPGINVDVDQCFALVGLYNSTFGDDWANSSGWGSADVESWFGVSIDAVAGTVLSIDLHANNLLGILPQELDALTSLQSLLLYDNQIVHIIPPRLGNLSALRNLDLSGNLLTGSIPSELGRLGQLRLLVLHGNRLTGLLPGSFAQLTQLQTLYLFDNQLSGPVDVLATLPSLRSALLSNNQFSGALPVQLGQLTQLESLFLDRNQLQGPISPCIGNAAQLRDLVLFDNALEGGIPPELGNLAQLETLSLGENRLRGTLPSTLSALRLQFFGIDHNRLDADSGNFAIIPPALQAWFSAIPATSHGSQAGSDVLFESGFEYAGCGLP